MEITLLTAALTILFTLAIAATLRRRRHPLPPGPAVLPLLGNLFWLSTKPAYFKSAVASLWSKHGPMIKIQIASLPMIMVSGHDLIHKMLIEHGAVFSDRPSASLIRFFSEDLDIISKSNYGYRWRLLRRNLNSEMLSSSRIKSMEEARDWALEILIRELESKSNAGNGEVRIREAFRFSIFSLAMLLCFGEKAEDSVVRDIETARRDLLSFAPNLLVFEILPKLGRLLCRERWRNFVRLLERQKEILLPLVKSRRREKESRDCPERKFKHSYLDSLLELEIQEEKSRKLDDEEIMYLCAEFIDGSTETTAAALEWIMANIIRNPSLQEKLAEEMKNGNGEEDSKEKKYLRAVVLEGLRRHPPSHFLIYHAASEEISIGGYIIPRGMNVNYGVTSVNWDAEIWPDPMEFRPERFLAGGEGEEIDITGSKRIQMLTFGAGRRICPGMNLALLHLEFFVGNLVRDFRWEAVGEIDMAEKTEFTVVLETPLTARISRRF